MVRVRNDARIPISMVANDRHVTTPDVGPGEEGWLILHVNEDLRKIRVSSSESPADSIEREFNRRRGYTLHVTVTGPPLEMAVREESY
jgi:hypothetical protein